VTIRRSRTRNLNRFLGIPSNDPLMANQVAGALNTSAGDCLVRFPDSCSDVAIGKRLVMEIIDCYHLAISALDTTRVAEIGPATVAANRDFLPPSAASIGAQAGANAIGLRPESVSQAEPPVHQVSKARGITFTHVRD